MKYPQFVSTRAINAISDWLVSRLEQLGVEAPVIYGRLLLSLLHTPLQINALDLAELSDIKQQSIFGRNNNCRDYYKSSGRRIIRSPDADTLKRLAAIESLIDVVSTSDQDIACIADLVDELSEKLREVEAQGNQEEDVMKPTRRVEQIKKSQSASPDDPVNRYYSAFPALSKELAKESQKSISKSLTWPKNHQQNRLNQSSKSAIVNVVVASGGKIKDDMNRNSANSTNGVINRRGKTSRRRRQSSKNKMLSASASLGRHNKSGIANLSASSSSSSISSVDVQNNPPQSNHHSQLYSVHGDGQEARKNNTGGGGVHRMQQRPKNISAPWDTDFDGQWEMGEDLIHEFILDQNKRNRSISEGHCNILSMHRNNLVNAMKDEEEDDDSNNAGYLIIDDGEEVDEHSSLHIENLLDMDKEEKYMVKLAELCGNDELVVIGEMGQICGDNLLMRVGDDDHFYECNGSGGGVITPETLSSVNSSQRRLYEREVSPEFSGHNVESLKCCDSEEEAKLFEAKFNKSVEALWNNEKPIAPVKNEDGFWKNYYKHCYNDKVDMMDLNAATKQGAAVAVSQNYAGSGLQLTSTIWSESAQPGTSKDECNDQEQRSSFWENATAVNTAAAFAAAPLEENKKSFAVDAVYKREAVDSYFGDNAATSLGYRAYNMPNAPKWSECSFEAPFVSNAFKQSEYSEYKSLPLMQQGSRRLDCTDERVYQSMLLEDVEKNVEPLPFNGPPISLPNHSQSESAFLRVRPALIKRGVQLEEPPMSNEPEEKNDDEEEENLLTAPRTHFKPIKQTYPNGHVFNIPGYWDEIEYQRMDDDSLIYNGKNYKEYIPSLLNRRPGSLVLKYCVIEPNEASSQTEYEIGRILLGSKILGARSRSINSPSSRGGHSERLNIFTNMMARDKQPLDIELEEDLDLEEEGEEESSFQNEITLNMDAWRRAGVKRKCLNNNNVHTLWENCSTCNNEIKSLPANPKMIDELDAEADEIMSDLKHLQNLYIGSDEWDDENVDEDHRGVAGRAPIAVATNYVELNCKISENAGAAACGAAFMDDYNDVGFYNVNKLISDLLKPETAMSLAQALGNGHHEDILKGISHLNANDMDMISAADNFENEKTIWKSWHTMQNNNNQYPQELVAAAAPSKMSIAGSSAVVASDNKYVGGLWTNSHENNIWRKSGATKNEQDLRRQQYLKQQLELQQTQLQLTLSARPQQQSKRQLFTDRAFEPNNNNASSINQNNDDNLLWEHSYLEQIWNNENGNGQKQQQPPQIVREVAAAAAAETMEEKLRTAWDKIDNINIAQPIATASSSFSASQQQAMLFDLPNNYGGINVHSASVAPTSSSSLLANGVGKASLRYDRKRRHSASQNLLGAFNAAATDNSVRRIERVNSLVTASGGACADTEEDMVNVAAVVTYNYLANLNAAIVAANMVEKQQHQQPQEVEVPLLVSANSAAILNQVAIGARPITR